MLTYKEHEARAMLMGDGWVFHSSGFYYFNKNKYGPDRIRLDADTLDPISFEETRERGKKDMATESLSKSEHEARALLLGRRYSEWAGAYTDEDLSHNPRPWLDADTLKEIHHDEKFSRIQRHVFSEADTG